MEETSFEAGGSGRLEAGDRRSLSSLSSVGSAGLEPQSSEAAEGHRQVYSNSRGFSVLINFCWNSYSSYTVRCSSPLKITEVSSSVSNVIAINQNFLIF